MERVKRWVCNFKSQLFKKYFIIELAKNIFFFLVYCLKNGVKVQLESDNPRNS